MYSSEIYKNQIR